MAANQDVGIKRSKKYGTCPRKILNEVPPECEKVTFSDLVPGEDYKNKAIIGKIKVLNPLGRRADGATRKILITDALDESVNKLPVFLFGQIAELSQVSEVEGYIIVTNFIVQPSLSKKTDETPVQLLVKRKESQVWFARKVQRNSKRKSEASFSPKVKRNSKRKSEASNREKEKNSSDEDEPHLPPKFQRNSKRKSKGSNQEKKQKTSDEDESHPVPRHYEYTKLGDLVESAENYNVYGVVDKCDLKNGGKNGQYLELLLTDQTEASFACSIWPSESEIFPDVYPGDVVRIHRMKVNKFRHILRGSCSNQKYILVFSKHNEECDKPRSVAKTFTFIEEDKIRARDLLNWNKTKNDPKLICEIKKDDFVNIICQVVGVYVAKIEAVILKIWDGTKTNEFPGVHLGFKEEKLDQRLFTIARNYYVNVFVYGRHRHAAAELEPGKYIEIRDAHLYSTKIDPEEYKLTLHSGNEERRGITVLNETEDERVIPLKERLEKIISDTLEFGSQTDDLLSQNNSMFLNCDISAFNSQKTVEEVARTENPSNEERPVPDEEQVAQNGNDIDLLNEPLGKDDASCENTRTESPSNTETPAPDEEQVAQSEDDIDLPNEPLNEDDASCEKTIGSNVDASIKPGQSTQEFGLGMSRDERNIPVDENRMSVTDEPDIDLLNEPLSKDDASCEKTIVSVVDVSIKPGQSTQEFGLGMARDERSIPDDENRMSVTSEPDPICNLTPLQTRYFFHDPQKSSSQMTDSIFPTYATVSQEEWWNSVSTVSVTDQHSDVKPITLAEVAKHSVPHKFRVLASVFYFKPNINSIQKFIHLCCPKCMYISEDASPPFEPFETRDGLSYYFCPVCKDKEANQEHWPVLKYTFLVSLSLNDGTGPRCVETYLWKENAVKFFKGITPEEALRDSATADSILHMLWSICPNCRPFNSSNTENSSVYPILDCCILSYTAINGTQYQMFDTILV